MTDEEKKAIEFLNFYEKHCLKKELDNIENYETVNDEEFVSRNIKTVLNLIKEQQENYQSCMDYADSLNQDIGELLLNLEKKDKIINEMADRLEFVMKNSGIGLDPEHGMNFTINDIKEYFTKKVGE